MCVCVWTELLNQFLIQSPPRPPILLPPRFQNHKKLNNFNGTVYFHLRQLSLLFPSPHNVLFFCYGKFQFIPQVLAQI